MSWFTSLFAPAPNLDSRRGQAIHSTHDAFSLRTTSPVFGAHNPEDAFNPDVLRSPDTAGPSYTYPPQNTSNGSSVYGSVPTNLRSQRSSLLPTHHDAQHTPSYPPLSVTWNRLRAWLAREYPELGDTLNYGILPQDLAQLEVQFGFDLPRVVRESYLAVDGQEAESAAGCAQGLFFGLTLLPLEDVYDEWRFWREVDDDPTTGANPQLREVMQSIPTGWVRKEYSQRGWIPLIADKAGNYVGVDLNPDGGGAAGQVIVFGRDFDTKIVLWPGDGVSGWAKWLAAFVDDLENGEGFEIGTGDNSDGDEDDLGYESYFYDGSGRGQGDGGGDNGAAGGLKLAGEYRGWNVLEAWADRSYRKWMEMGVITEPIEPPIEDKQKITVSEVSTLETPAIKEEQDESLTPVNGRPSVPTISVSRPPPPPAPLPVDLPTQNDIDIPPSPSESPHSAFYDDDLESGRGLGMQELPGDPLSAGRTAPIPPPKAEPTPIPTAPPVAPIADLLVNTEADSDLLVDTLPVQPTIETPSAAETPSTVESEPSSAEAQLVDTEVPISEDGSPELVEVPEESQDADVTVRLVGGGGFAGVSPSEDELDGDFELGVDTDAESVAESVGSAVVVDVPGADDSAAKTKKSHKKSMSMASLKKLVRRKDSSASTKQPETEAAVPAS